MTIMKYTGAGAYWPGVPARDLLPEEWQAIPADVRDDLLMLGLYTRPDVQQQRSASRRAESAVSAPDTEKTNAD